MVRIISLVPSQTELLFDLGVGARVVGITKFCIHPQNARSQAVVIGGTKNFDFAKIEALKPDLIIGNKEENYREGIEILAAKFPVWISDISNLAEALGMIREVGRLTGAVEKAEQLAVIIQSEFDKLVVGQVQTAAYFIWRKPWMAAATGTFIDDMLEQAGFRNAFGNLTRYPEISRNALADAAPERIFLSSEPYPFRQKHFAEFQEICPNSRVEIVDGELFSWYGGRLQKSAAYFNRLR